MGRRRKCDMDTRPDRPRNAANERERDRMRVLSGAFAKLKTTLPWVPADTKLSKLDTLLMATRYIGYLRKQLLEDVESTQLSEEVKEVADQAVSHPINLVRHQRTYHQPGARHYQPPINLN